MTLSLEPLLSLWGSPLGSAAAATVNSVSTDSRGSLQGALFVPLVGERFDGHAFLETALAAGAAAAVAQADRSDEAALVELAQRFGVPIWALPDTQLAYQQLARAWRRQLALSVVGVTGSAGKTTTRELIRAALAPLGAVAASVDNENNDVGVPRTVLRAAADTRALVVEMAMRGLGEIERLTRCAEPDVAVITNIGTAHIGRLGSREAIAQAKCEIALGLPPDGLLVIPAGDPLLETALARVWSGRLVRVALADEQQGFDPSLPGADLVGDLAANGAMLRLGEGTELRLPLEGRHNARNLLLAVGVARELGLADAQLADLAVEVPGGRSRRQVLGGVAVLDETYTASTESMLAALDLLAQQGGGQRYAVLGTMLEQGELSEVLHRSVGERAGALAAAGRLDGLVIVDAGPDGAAMEAGAAGPLPRLARVDTPAAAAEVLLGWLQTGDTVLLKASRGVALERVQALLQDALAPGA
ncbi:MAG: UDP-N-acetylmuramoyl-tripeptide--D-alanyl-D-alanine ligase [Synechococcaceae cyanobacterium]